MQVLQGIAVSAGVAIGEALVIDNEGFVISRRTIGREAVDAELARLDGAIRAVSIEIDGDREAITAQTRPAIRRDLLGSSANARRHSFA